MRILHVAKKVPPVIGGDASAVDGLSRAQERAGHEVEVLAYAARGIPASPRIHTVGPVQEWADLDRITLRRIRALARMRGWARRNLSAVQPDVVHAHAVDVGLAVAPVARSLGIPAVLTCHGVWAAVHGLRSSTGRLERRLIQRGEYAAITTVDRVSLEALHRMGFPMARHVPNGVDVDGGPRTSEAGRPFRFLFVGRHERQKGLDVLLDAVAACRRNGLEGFAVDILGEGSETARHRNRARELGIEDLVHFRGILPREELQRAYRDAEALVMPSRFEGFPLAILEAWAAGLPVVATRVGGIPEICTEENAILVPPEDPAALAEAMALSARDLAAGFARAERGRALVLERFTWDAVARTFAGLYEGLPRAAPR